MSGIMYTQEEIEKKRLLALQRKKETEFRATSNPGPCANLSPKIVEPSTSKYLIHQPHSTSLNYGKQNGPVNSFKASKTQMKRNDNRYNPISCKNFFGQTQNICGTCYMIDSERFTLEMSAFFPPFVDIFKTIPSRRYDPTTKMWDFHLNDYENLLDKVTGILEVTVIGIPKKILQIFKKNLTTHVDLSCIDLSAVDPKLRSSLMPFQKEGLCYGISKNGRCIIADDMGLGKTIQALGIAHYYKNDWPLLIITPSSVRYQWSEAIHTFLSSIPTYYIYHFTNARDSIVDAKIVIVSYDLLVRAADTFQRQLFGFVIIDESHTIKSHKTARFKVVQDIVSRVQHVILLSGTPALSRPVELYTQINLVLPKFIKFQEYGVRYCAGVKKPFGWDYSGSSNLQELQALLKACCMVRRMKSDVLAQLPSKIRQVIILDPVLIEATSKEMEEVTKKLQQNSLKGMDKHSALLQLYSEASVTKVKAICNHISNLLDKRQKFLVFAHHHNVLDAISDVAESKQIRYIRIDGKTNPEQRKLQVDKFQEREDYLLAVLSITAANAGITLTAAQLVVFAELFWNPGILCQAEDRVHRLGQEGNVLIQYLVAKQTVDDYLWPLINKKLSVLNSAGLEQDFSLSAANVKNQSPVKERQKKLESYFNNPVPECKLNTNDSEKSTGENERSSKENIHKLLDIDEEAFNSTEWDNFQ